MKKVTDLTENEVIHCPTEQEYIEICKLMDEAGLKWCTGSAYSKENMWAYYQEKTCYYPKKGQYSDIGYYKEINYTIHQAKDFISNLKTNNMSIKIIIDGKELDLNANFKEVKITQEPVIMVPDGIEIGQDSEGNLGIINGKQVLLYHQGHWIVVMYAGKKDNPKCRLTPIKREDLKAGDVAFRSDNKADFDVKRKYCIILNKGYQYWNDPEGCNFADSNWNHWYKVESI